MPDLSDNAFLKILAHFSRRLFIIITNMYDFFQIDKVKLISS